MLTTATVLVQNGSGTAGAATTGPPIAHVPATTAAYGRPIPVTATTVCETGSTCSARLYWRTTTPAAAATAPGLVGEGGFQVVSMARGATTTIDGREAVDWSTTIPGAAVTTRGVDYFLEAEVDGTLTRFPGSPEAAGVASVGSYVHVHVLSPPLLNHVPVVFAVAGRPFDVEARVSCASGNCSATLHYRRTPATFDPNAGWASVAMQPNGPGTPLGDAGVHLVYGAQVPASSVDTTGTDYYIHVLDGHTQAYSPGTGYVGWYAPRDGTRVSAATHHVHVVEPPRVAHVPPASVAYRADVAVSARANCAAAKQCHATLYYRTTTPGIASGSAFTVVPMSVSRIAGADGIDVIAVEGTIPSAFTDTRGVDYFFSVTDGTATSWWPGTTPVDGPGVWVDGTRVVYQHVHVREPVHLSHVPPGASQALEDLVIEAEASCATEQCAVQLHYTPTPATPGTYRTVSMARTFAAENASPRPERWRAVVPGADVTTRGVAYYFTASDGYTNTAAPGTSYWGAYAVVDGGPVVPEAVRYVLRVVDPPHPVHLPVLATVAGEQVRIEARSNCATGHCAGTLHWRVPGALWRATPMAASTLALQTYGNDLVAYTAAIDGASVTPAGLEYRVELHDGYVTETTPTYPVAVAVQGLARHTAGKLAFHGTAHLPRFPCDRDPLEGNPCTGGTFRGDWAASIGGQYGTSTFQATWNTASGDALRADFVYSEWDCFNGTETLLGFARGTGSAEAAPGSVQGKWQVLGESFGRDVSGVTLTFEFTWTRTLNGVELVVEPTALTLDIAGLGPRLVATGRQAGTAVFSVSTEEGTAVPTCEQPRTDVQGQVAGSVDVASSGLAA